MKTILTLILGWALYSTPLLAARTPTAGPVQVSVETFPDGTGGLWLVASDGTVVDVWHSFITSKAGVTPVKRRTLLQMGDATPAQASDYLINTLKVKPPTQKQ